MKQTLAIIKPDALKRNLLVPVLLAAALPYRIDAMEMLQLSEGTAEALYEEHRGRPYFDRLIDFTVSGPLIVMALSLPFDPHTDIVTEWRSSVLVIRQRYCPKDHPGPDNLVHGSDSTLSALRELRIFWPGR